MVHGFPITFQKHCEMCIIFFVDWYVGTFLVCLFHLNILNGSKHKIFWIWAKPNIQVPLNTNSGNNHIPSTQTILLPGDLPVFSSGYRDERNAEDSISVRWFFYCLALYIPNPLDSISLSLVLWHPPSNFALGKWGFSWWEDAIAPVKGVVGRYPPRFGITRYQYYPAQGRRKSFSKKKWSYKLITTPSSTAN